jgi:hypothetical protein
MSFQESHEVFLGLQIEARGFCSGRSVTVELESSASGAPPGETLEKQAATVAILWAIGRPEFL